MTGRLVLIEYFIYVCFRWSRVWSPCFVFTESMGKMYIEAGLLGIYRLGFANWRLLLLSSCYLCLLPVRHVCLPLSHCLPLVCASLSFSLFNTSQSAPCVFPHPSCLESSCFAPYAWDLFRSSIVLCLFSSLDRFTKIDKSNIPCLGTYFVLVVLFMFLFTI